MIRQKNCIVFLPDGDRSFLLMKSSFSVERLSTSLSLLWELMQTELRKICSDGVVMGDCETPHDMNAVPSAGYFFDKEEADMSKWRSDHDRDADDEGKDESPWLSVRSRKSKPVTMTSKLRKRWEDQSTSDTAGIRETGSTRCSDHDQQCGENADERSSVESRRWSSRPVAEGPKQTNRYRWEARHEAVRGDPGTEWSSDSDKRDEAEASARLKRSRLIMLDLKNSWKGTWWSSDADPPSTLSARVAVPSSRGKAKLPGKNDAPKIAPRRVVMKMTESEGKLMLERVVKDRYNRAVEKANRTAKNMSSEQRPVPPPGYVYGTLPHAGYVRRGYPNAIVAQPTRLAHMYTYETLPPGFASYENFQFFPVPPAFFL